MNKRMLFYGVVAIQVLFLLGMVIFKQMTLWNGTAVLLKPVPVDPTDFLRGDFVNLRYDISTLSGDLASQELSRGQTVFVSLEDKGEYWDAKSISASKGSSPYLRGIIENSYSVETYTITEQKTGKNYQYDLQIYEGMVYEPRYLNIGDKVQFNVMDGNGISWADKCAQKCIEDEFQKVGVITNLKPKGKEYSIRYPIESYFIPRDSGDIPELMNVSNMLVEVKIWNGDAVVTKLLYNGKEIKFK